MPRKAKNPEINGKLENPVETIVAAPLLVKKLPREPREINGRLANSPSSLADVWGETKRPTQDINEYEAKLKTMNLVDIQEHGLKQYNLRPNSERSKMVSACIREFERAKTVKKGLSMSQNKMADNDKKTYLDLMARSRR